VLGLGVRVSGEGFRVQGFKIWASQGLEFWV